MASIDNATKAKLNNYNLVKGSLLQMQRKKTRVLFIFRLQMTIERDYCRGNLSVRSLVDIVTKEHTIQDSEYLETLLVAVPQ